MTGVVVNKLINAGVSIAIIGAVAFVLMPEKKSLESVDIIEQSAYIPPARAGASISPVKFVDVTKKSGISFQHFNGGGVNEDGEETRYMPETMGPGVVIFDYDQDGDSDIFVTNSKAFSGVNELSKVTPRLYRNEGDMKFTDRTREMGLEIQYYGMGASVADYDGDTFPDLLLTGWGKMMLFHNNGGKYFAEVTESVIPDANQQEYPDWSTSALFFDVDVDGDLDIYVANYVSWTPTEDVFATIDGVNKSYAMPTLYHGSSSRLYLQDKGVFSDVTESSGMLNDNGKSLGAALWDFDDDGLLDIVVANDTQPNFLYHNLGGGKFENRALELGIAYDANGKTRAGMGIDVADVGNDGHLCIVIGNFSGEPLTVFRDEGEGFFREIGQQAHVAEDTYLSLTFGLVFADFDLDGLQDLVLSNGHIEPNIEDVEAEIKYRQTLQLLGNRGDVQFENWSDTAGDIFSKPIVGRGIAAGDLDSDGDVDIVVTENNGALYLLRNDTETKNKYVRVKLRGEKLNTDAIGAKIKLVMENGDSQQRIVKGGSSYLSQSELIQTFGLGSESSLKKMEIIWPNGRTKEYDISEFNKTYMINENDDQMISMKF